MRVFGNPHALYPNTMLDTHAMQVDIADIGYLNTYRYKVKVTS